MTIGVTDYVDLLIEARERAVALDGSSGALARELSGQQATLKRKVSLAERRVSAGEALLSEALGRLDGRLEAEQMAVRHDAAARQEDAADPIEEVGVASFEIREAEKQLRRIDRDLKSLRARIERAERSAPSGPRGDPLPDLSVAMREGRSERARAEAELEALAQELAEIRRRVEAELADRSKRLASSDQVLARGRTEFVSRMDKAQTGFVRAIAKEVSASDPLAETEIEASKLTALEKELRGLMGQVDAAQAKLKALLDGQEQARRERWARARRRDMPALLGAAFFGVLLPLLSGAGKLSATGSGMGLAAICGIVGLACVFFSGCAIPARTIGRSQEEGDDVLLTGGERVQALARGWLLLPVVSALLYFAASSVA